MGFDWTTGLGILGAIIAFIVLGPAAGAYIMTRALCNPRLVRFAPQPPANDPLEEASRDSQQWARANGFTPLGRFQLEGQSALIAAWGRTDRASFFCQYVFPSKSTFDLVTAFADDVGLTTASTMEAQFSPHPAGSYAQSFSGLTLEQRWARHLEMEKYLTETGGARPAPRIPDFEPYFTDCLRRQARFIRSLPLWPLRAAYWFFLRRRLRHNLSVKDQHERGWIRMPHELMRGGLT